MSKIISEDSAAQQSKAPSGPKGQGAGGGEEKVRKQARQLAYDVRYKVKQQFKDGQKADEASLKRAYLSQLGSSPAPGPVKQLAKTMLVGEAYDFTDIDTTVSNTISNVLNKVFVEGIKEEPEPVEEEVGKYKVRVTDKKTGRSYVRMADRAKMSELRKNPNISSVEMTGYGTPYEGEKKKGESTSKVKSGKGLSKKDYDGDGKRETPEAEYKGSKDKAIKKAVAKEDVDVDEGVLVNVAKEAEKVGGAAKKKIKSGAKKVVKGAARVAGKVIKKTAAATARGAAGVVGGAIKGAVAGGYKGIKKGLSEEELKDLIQEKPDIADILARLEKKRISKGGDPDASPLGKKVGGAMKAKQDAARKKAGVKTEEVVSELKTSTLRSYANRASIEAVGRGVDAGVKGMTGPKKEMEKNMTKAYKRQQGINRAVNKLASRAEKAEKKEEFVPSVQSALSALDSYMESNSKLHGSVIEKKN
jgi:hypothetical protein